MSTKSVAIGSAADEGITAFNQLEGRARIHSWIFFCTGAKRTSMRRALAERIAEWAPVVIVERASSLWRTPASVRLSDRCLPLDARRQSWIYRPLHLPEKVPAASIIGRALNRRLLRAELEKLSPQATNRIVCFDAPAQHHLAGRLNEKLSVYIVVDDLTLNLAGDPIAGEAEAERRLLSSVNHVVCVSEHLAAKLRERGRLNPPPSILHNGFDERLFSPAAVLPEPAELAGIPKPRVLTAGHISERMDWNGIVDAAKLRPDWTWIFVGPADARTKGRLEGLHRLIERPSARAKFPALLHFPAVPVEEVPAWIAHCQACAVPYRLNSFTLASNPLKAIEYLAMGAPVFSTRVPALLRYGNVIQWVNEGDGPAYATALDVLEQSSKQTERIRARRSAVAEESWAARAHRFLQILNL